ncbi:hypothetical protein [Candidatus Odyssella thessalonicensis]|nr:hypothetical protein [Candidatus Odyssella thessalonicensis]
MNSLLCCYFPTKVIFVDDNALFLQNSIPILDHDIASYEFFDDPLKAL